MEKPLLGRHYRPLLENLYELACMTVVGVVQALGI
jgi:hypothetical protein